MNETSEPAPEIAERDAQPYIGIRGEVSDGVPALMDAIFPELFGWIGRNGVEVTGPAIVRCWEVDGDNEPLLMEAGAPVAAAPELEGEIRADVLPAGRYLTLVHAGPYRSEELTDMADTRARLIEWAEREGHAISRPSEAGRKLPCSVDHLLLGPAESSDFTTWRTELAYLIDGD